jgi:hypothetical protein
LVVLPSEVFERCAEQRLGFAEAFVNPGLVLGISPVHEGCEPFGHKPDLVTKVFDQDAVVTLDPIEALVNRRKALVVCIQSLVNPIEPLIVTVKPLLYPIEALIDSGKLFCEVLNEFLIHGAAASGRVCSSGLLVNETRRLGKRLKTF